MWQRQENGDVFEDEWYTSYFFYFSVRVLKDEVHFWTTGEMRNLVLSRKKVYREFNPMPIYL